MAEDPTKAPPRRSLAAGVVIGAAIGAAIGFAGALVLVLALGAVGVTERLGVQALIYLGGEAAFAGAILGGIVAGLMRLRNTR
ncbi:hypothetical protein DDZ18_01360 [Marinicauda salina]|uniref:Uncharacterized protein n=1 Tax=Marinicauda salina TaxID=2135793 RepID=A0A2U2BWD9_9PROT|nr:hypothetical protein [Marinicauda salina]PWE18284.1 hypothetical protein DDZ18_01360 [Marinicauda salina]